MRPVTSRGSRMPASSMPAAGGRRLPWRSGLAALDRQVLSRIAATDSRVLDHVLPALGRAADHSMLWLAVSAGLAVSGDKWARRAALRGIAGIVVASSTTNLLVKGMTGRDRPPGEIPVPGRLVAGQVTTSFLSGHAASAAAFATGVALEMPVLAVPAGALAAAVGLSRVVTGVHYPSDVLAGFALGTAAGAVTLRWWPLRRGQQAAAIRPRREAPAAPAGQGLVLAMNEAAGATSAGLVARLREELPDAKILEVPPGEDIAALLRDAAAGARILGVAGGDGTVNVAAGVAVDTGRPLLIIPAGTFNHFATDLGVHSVQESLTALRSGDAVLVDVGTAGQRCFVNTSSTGVYADLVHAREQLESGLGKWPAVLFALARVMRHSRPTELVVNGRRRRLWLLFAGNCRYEPLGFAPSYRPDLSDGKLDIRIVDAGPPLARARLLTAVLTGTLGRCRVYKAWTAASIDLASGSGDPIRLSLDGEVSDAGMALRMGKRAHGLLIYRPASD
jgi:diacylglycerol kinase family enzyme/membrane-associated phospholipid phosphatase